MSDEAKMGDDHERRARDDSSDADGITKRIIRSFEIVFSRTGTAILMTRKALRTVVWM